MASSVSVIATTTNQHHMDRLDAARALLGVSPSAENSSPPNTSRLSTPASVTFAPRPPRPPTTTTRICHQQTQTTAQHSRESRFPLTFSPALPPAPPPPPRPAPAPPAALVSSLTHGQATRTVSFEKPLLPKPQVFQLAPPAVISNGLDALAALASSEQASWEQHQRQQRRTMSASSTTTASCSSSSEEDEDAEAMPPPPPRAGGRRRSVSNPEGMEKWADRPSSRRHFVLPASILEEELAEASAAMEAHERKNSAELLQLEDKPKSTTQQQQTTQPEKAPISGLMSEEEQANLTPEELLKRARSRLLEDLSEGSLNGEKGVLTLPHSLSKYKEVYNKNGRIGIYTPAERAAIIARFNHKRSRRVWNKKIRYNCRKNLADRRMRVKGRFVKRSTEQQARAEAVATTPSPAPKEQQETTPEPSETADEDMPDVTDPEAGFCPTEDQPYRRTRRHTIT